MILSRAEIIRILQATVAFWTWLRKIQESPKPGGEGWPEEGRNQDLNLDRKGE